MIGFDLDGCLCDIHTPALRLMDQFKGDIEEFALMYDVYVRNVTPRFNAKNLMHEDDDMVIITARPTWIPSVVDVTYRWCNKYYPGVDVDIVGQNPTPEDKAGFKLWHQDIINRKINACKLHKVDMYCDDSPSIVEGLRKVGIPTIQLGGRL